MQLPVFHPSPYHVLLSSFTTNLDQGIIQLMHHTQDDSRVAVLWLRGEQYSLLHYNARLHVSYFHKDGTKRPYAIFSMRYGVWYYQQYVPEQGDYCETHTGLKDTQYATKPDWEQLTQLELEMAQTYLQTLIDTGKLAL